MSIFYFWFDLLDLLSYIIYVPPPCLFLALLLHSSTSCGRYIIIPLYWGLQSWSFPALLLIRSSFQPWILNVYPILEFILPHWSQEHSALCLRPGVSWCPGTSRDLLHCHERSTRSTSWLWLVLALPYTNSYRVQVHEEGTQVGFYIYIYIFFCILFQVFCGLVLPLFSTPTWRIGGIHQTVCFLFWWFPSPCVWKIYLAVSRRSQNLTRYVSP